MVPRVLPLLVAAVLSSSGVAVAQTAEEAHPIAAAPTWVPWMGAVHVHVNSDRPVGIEREADGPDPKRLAAEEKRAEEDAANGEEAPLRAPRKDRHKAHWESVCTSPCDQDLALDARYRIVGDGLRKTSPFLLSGKPGDNVTIAFDGASTRTFVGGIVVGGVGVAAVGLGLLALLIVGIDHSNGVHTKDAASYEVFGAACIGGGLLTTGVGLVATLGNLHSDAKQVLDSRTTVALPAPRTVSLLSTSF